MRTSRLAKIAFPGLSTNDFRTIFNGNLKRNFRTFEILRVSSFLVNMNLILICRRLLINLKSTSESSGDYTDNLRSKHVTATVFFLKSQIMLYIYSTNVKLSTQQMS